MLWCLYHGVFPFLGWLRLHLLMQPWPSPRAGCASVKRLRRDLKSSKIARARREAVLLLFGWKLLDARRGAAPLSHGGSRAIGFRPAGGEQERRGFSKKQRRAVTTNFVAQLAFWKITAPFRRRASRHATTQCHAMNVAL